MNQSRVLLKVTPSSKQTALIFFILLPHFKPEYFQVYVPIVDSLFNIGRIISGLILIFVLIVRRQRVSWQLICFMLSQIWLVVNSWSQNGVTNGPFLFALSNVVICLVIENYIKDAAPALIHAFVILFELLLYINLITIILYPNGIQSHANWFLGYRNAFEITYVFASVCAFIWAEYSGQYVRLFLLMGCIIISAILAGSATGLVIAILLPLLYYSRLYQIKAMQIKVVIAGFLALFFGLVFLRAQNYLSSLFEILGRNVTLTGRIYIWDVAIKSISKSPLFGYGMQSAETRAAMVKKAYGATSSHNFILEQLYNGGIVLLGLLILSFLHSFAELNKYKNHRYAHLFLIGAICYFTTMLVESVNYLHLYGFFFLAGYIGQIIQQMPATKERLNQ